MSRSEPSGLFKAVSGVAGHHDNRAQHPRDAPLKLQIKKKLHTGLICNIHPRTYQDEGSCHALVPALEEDVIVQRCFVVVVVEGTASRRQRITGLDLN